MRNKSSLMIPVITIIILTGWIVPAAADWGSWTSGGEGVCTEDGSQFNASIAEVGNGCSIIAWIDTRGSSYSIYAQKIDADGDPLWQEDGVIIADNTYIFGSFISHQVVPDGNGGAIIVFNCYSGIAFLYAQKVGADGTLPWGPEGAVIMSGSMLFGCESLDAMPDGAGGAIIAYGWHERVYNGSTGWYDDYYRVSVQRLDSSGNLIWYPDPAGICLGSNFEAPVCYPQIVSDENGGCIAAWIDEDHDVRAARVNAGGSVLWNNQVNIGNYNIVDVDDNSPQLVADGSGGAIISWDHSVTYAYDDHWYKIYAQHVNSSGTAQWVADKWISTVYPADADHRVVSDGDGGAIYVFGSKDPGPSPETYKWLWAQRIDGDGNQPWSDTGVMIVDPIMVGKEFSAATDGNGGVITTWCDARLTGNYNIYAQRVDADGVKKWSASGLPVCTVSNRQGHPAMIYHGNDGTIIAWTDLRDDSGDIYAQQVDNCYLEITNVEVNTTFDSPSYTWDAEITFETNLPATSVVAYDPDMDCYPACSYSQQQAGVEETEYTVVLTGLAAANEYCYKITVESEDDPMDCPVDVTGSFALNNNYSNIYSNGASFNAETCKIHVYWYTKFPSKQNKVYYRRDGAIPWQQVAAYQDDCDEDRFYLAKFPVSASTDYEYKISTVIDNVTYQTGVFEIRSGRCSGTLPDPLRVSSVEEQKPYLRAWPNPFNPSTLISFNLPEAAEIEINIYSVNGRHVKTLVSGHYARKVHQVTWNGTNDYGESVSSGIYFARMIIAGKDLFNTKLLLLK
ncbi:MAG: T9SS type A sorting domain-containing protein [Candidatus Krumholzibacteriota bacterium]|nr:T9SS type A sorting domain-containing protein [Candidatus Krumholzibacteriota bacterium]